MNYHFLDEVIMMIKIEQLLNTLLYSYKDSAFLHLAGKGKSTQLISKVHAKKKVLVAENENIYFPTICMTKIKYLERYNLKYDIIYNTIRDESDCKLLPKLFEILNKGGFIVSGYYFYATVANFVMEINQAKNDIKVISFSVKNGGVAIFYIEKDANNSKEEVIDSKEYTKKFPSTTNIPLADQNKEIKVLLNLKSEDYIYELARKNQLKLQDHLQSIFNFQNRTY